MILIQYILSLLNIPFTKKHLRNIFDENPNNNNLLGWAQILAYYGVETRAVKIKELKDIEPIWLPCITSFNNEFVVMQEIKIQEIVLYAKNGIINVGIDSFIQGWNGILLLIKSGKYMGEPFYKKHMKYIKREYFIHAFFTICVLFTLLLWGHRQENLCTLISVSGFVIGGLLSFFILKKSVAENINIKICNYKYFDCNMKFKVAGKIELCDLSLTYFISMFLITLLYSHGNGIIQLLLLPVIPFILWSLFYQIFNAKKVCPLCLFIIFALIVLLLVNFTFECFDLEGIMFADFLGAILIFVISFILVKKIRIKIGEQKSYNTLQKDCNLLKESVMLLVKECQVEKPMLVTDCTNDIVIGDMKTPNTIVAALNPYCAPCYKNFLQAYNSLFAMGNIRLEIRFIYWDDKQYEALKYIFTAIQSGMDSVEKVIFNWFEIGIKDIDSFISKYSCRETTDLAVKNIEQHKQWCLNNKVNSSPVLFYNGYRLPKGINIIDIINVV